MSCISMFLGIINWKQIVSDKCEVSVALSHDKNNEVCSSVKDVTDSFARQKAREENLLS